MARILVVDDHPSNRDFIVTLLGYAGHSLLQAADGAEALALVRSERPELVITDILMPSMDGYEFVRQLRADPQLASTQVIFCTAAYNEEQGRTLAEKCGVAYLLGKPTEPEIILRTVEKALGGQGSMTMPAIPPDFNQEHLQLLTDKLSAKVADLESLNQRLSALVDLGRDLGLERDARHLAQTFCQAARGLLGARYAALGLLNNARTEFDHYLIDGLGSGEVERIGKPSPAGGLIGRLLDGGRSLRLDGAEYFRNALDNHPPASCFLGMPISSPSRQYGLLYVVDKLGSETFGDDDERMALALAAQAAVAVENLHRYDDIQHHAAQLQQEIIERSRAEAESRLLTKMTLAVSEAEDLHSALGIALRKICEATGWVLGQAWTPRPDGTGLECSPAWHYTVTGVEKFRAASQAMVLAPGVGLPGRAWEENRTVLCDDVSRGPDFPHAGLARQAGLCLGIAIPAQAGAEVIAVLEFFGTGGSEEHDEHTVEFARAIAAQLGSVIQRKRVEEVVRVRGAQQAAVAGLGQDGLAGMDLDELMSKAALLVARQLEVEFCEVLELLPEGKAFRLRAAFGLSTSLIGRTVFSTEADTQACFTLSSSGPVIVSDMSAETRFAVPLLLREEAIASGMSVIIHGTPRPFGVLATHARRPRMFTRDDINFLQSSANLIASAVERNRTELELHHAKEAAESANRAKDQFLARLSHELRTPLTPVLVTVSAMLDDSRAPEDMRSMLEMTRRNIELEARLIDDLLDLTRITSGRLQLNRQPVDAHTLIEQALETCQSDIEASGVNIGLELVAQSHMLLADAARIQQILWNLIKNAVKFTPAGGNITIRSQNRTVKSGTSPEELLRIDVTDTGVGIDESFLPRLFNAFEHGESASGRRFGGLGLGLAISRSVAEAHQGQVSAASAGPGAGATFTLELPAHPLPVQIAPRPAPAAPAAPAAASHPRTEPLRILLVEDNKDTLRNIAMLLELRQHTVRQAERLEPALALAAGEPFDILISDIELPDGSGLDLMRHLRASPRPMPAIAMSGFGTEEDIQNSLGAGFAEHLTKPIDFLRLETAIQRVINADRARRTVYS